MQTAADLRNELRRIDHKSYPAYKDLKGSYAFEGYQLSIDHVQGDPFASPSRVSIHVKGAVSGFPKELYDARCKRVMLQDYLLRHFAGQLQKVSFQAKGSGKSGLMSVSRCGQEILERTACRIEEKTGDLVLCMEVGFPANGRTVNSRELEKIFFTFLPECVKQSLYYVRLDKHKLSQNADLAEDVRYIRDRLPELGLAAFVADGSVLPRESGVSGRPMKGAVKFHAPDSMAVTLELPHRGPLRGMGVRRGITLIVGGGYHGKSTLLKALELGVYDHIAGDGREYVVTDDTAVKLRAEDGRSIQKVDISLFISDLPNGKDTKAFYTQDASGSTSQAAGVVEGMEAGAGVFLIDEDTSATNFMIRDELMQRVVHRDAEPITPFIDRVRELYTEYGISTVLVAGSSGAYFHKADCIVQMNRYEPVEITELAKKEAERFPIPTDPAVAVGAPDFNRRIAPERQLREDGRVKIKVMGRDSISVNRDVIDLRYVEQLADAEQLAALGHLLKYAGAGLFDGKRTVRQVADTLWELVEKKGLAAVCGGGSLSANLALPRKQEIFACLNRCRMLSIR